MECLECKKEFKAKRETAKYCSSKCRKLAFQKVSVLSVPAKKEVSVPAYPQGQCHACGEPFAEVFKDTGCICLDCTNAGITHLKLGLDINACKNAYK